MFGFVRACHPPPLPPDATYPPLWLRTGVAIGVMRCGIWAGEKEPLHDSMLSLTGPMAITLDRLSLSILTLSSIFLLFLAACV